MITGRLALDIAQNENHKETKNNNIICWSFDSDIAILLFLGEMGSSLWEMGSSLWEMGSSLLLTLINFEQGSTVDLTPLIFPPPGHQLMWRGYIHLQLMCDGFTLKGDDSG